MSVNITVNIPIDDAASIRAINYDLARVDGDVEFTLAMITSAVIEAIKDLPDDSFDGFGSHRTSSCCDLSTNSAGSIRSVSIGSGVSNFSAQTTSTVDSSDRSFSYGDFALEVVDSRDICYEIPASGDMTVNELNSRVEQAMGLPAFQQRLLLRGYRLNQLEATLRSYGIGPGSRLHVLTPVVYREVSI